MGLSSGFVSDNPEMESHRGAGKGENAGVERINIGTRSSALAGNWVKSRLEGIFEEKSVSL